MVIFYPLPSPLITKPLTSGFYLHYSTETTNETVSALVLRVAVTKCVKLGNLYRKQPPLFSLACGSAGWKAQEHGVVIFLASSKKSCASSSLLGSRG